MNGGIGPTNMASPNIIERNKRKNSFLPLWYVLPPCAITGLLWLSSTNTVSLYQAGLSLLLLLVPWISFLRWRERPKPQLPLFALVSGMYWVYFGVAMFWGETQFVVFRARGPHIPESTISAVVLMAVVGVFAMLAGTRVASLTVSIPAFRLGSPRSGGDWLYIDLILLFSLVASRFIGAGGNTRQVVIILLDFVPFVAFALLFQKFFAGRAKSYEKILLAVFLLVKVATGLASGVMGSVAALFIIIGALYLQVCGKVPKTAVVLLVVYILFFQVGKSEFRQQYWTNQSSAGTIERMMDWIGFSLEMWGAFYEHPTAERFQALVGQSVSRLSLMPMAAAVMERTPASVPYQNGKLYNYMLITLIPRFMWPEKPSFNEANQFFQVAYGLTRLRDLGGVSISVGIMAEAYINFGWPGVIVIMFLMGVFLSVFQSIFFMPETSAVLTAIGIVLLPSLLAIESQLVQYFGGMIQQVAMAYLVLLPVMAKSRKKSARRVRPQPSHDEPLAVRSR